MGSAQRDNYGVPGLLGHGANGVVPIKATQDGKLCVKVDAGGAVGGSAPVYHHKLVKTIVLDLSTARTKEVIAVDFDCMAIGVIEGEIILAVDGHSMTINKCLSMDLTASSIQVSNERQEGVCEVWFFKKKEVME